MVIRCHLASSISHNTSTIRHRDVVLLSLWHRCVANILSPLRIIAATTSICFIITFWAIDLLNPYILCMSSSCYIPYHLQYTLYIPRKVYSFLFLRLDICPSVIFPLILKIYIPIIIDANY